MLKLFRAVSLLPRCSRVAMSSAAPRGEEAIDVVRSRLLYQSKKRGILENDILLGDFAEQNLGKMDRATLSAYDKLINGEHMEWDLFYYISDKKPAPEEVAACPAFQLLKSFVNSKKQNSKSA